MRKFFAFFLGFVMSLALLTGCGKSTATPTTDYHGEGEIQGGIKSDEDIAAITQEAEQDTEQPSYEDNTGHEPDGYSTGNYQDYWKSTSYFDIVEYLKANGAEDVYTTNANSYPMKDDSNINLYVASFYGEQWEITVMAESGVTIGHVYCDNDGRLRKNPHYIISCPPEKLGEVVTVDENGTTMRMGVINLVDSVVQYMKLNHDSDDPLNGSGLNYTSQPL